MDDLTKWLGEQLDTDERIARAATPGPWQVDNDTYAESINAADGVQVIAGGRWGGEASVFESTEDALHIAEWDPARALREIEVKRKLLALYVEHERMDRETFEAAGQHARSLVSLRAAYLDAVRHHAAVYANRPGFRKEWRP